MTEFVYIAIYEGKPEGPVKIGFSTNLRSRISSLNTSSHTPIVCHAYFSVDQDGLRIEAAAHLDLAEHRLNGEWFNVSWDVAAAAIAKAGEMSWWSLDSGIDEGDCLPTKEKQEARPKSIVTISLDEDLHSAMRKEWPDWQTRLNKILRGHFGMA